MKGFAFTFGCGSPLAHCYVDIAAPDEMTARLHMSALFSGHWASCYPREGFDAQIQRYDLMRIPVNLSASVRLGTNHAELSREHYEAFVRNLEACDTGQMA